VASGVFAFHVENPPIRGLDDNGIGLLEFVDSHETSSEYAAKGSFDAGAMIPRSMHRNKQAGTVIFSQVIALEESGVNRRNSRKSSCAERDFSVGLGYTPDASDGDFPD
jgi:hypothetical protein